MIRFVVLILSFMLIGGVFDIYFFFGVKDLFQPESAFFYFKIIYFSISGLFFLASISTLIYSIGKFQATKKWRVITQTSFFILFAPKIFACIFLFLDDVLRLFRWLIFEVRVVFFSHELDLEYISRLKIIQITAFSSFIIVITALLYGVILGGYRYKVIKQQIVIPNLPAELRGMKIIQISDLHLGSFLSVKHMQKAVKIINEIEADLLLFTGDLVNDKAEEAFGFIDVFKSIKHKVYSITGNHDYPEYVYSKSNKNGRNHNFKLIVEIHKKMGFELLINENRIIHKNGKDIALMGIENWGSSFSKYGDLSRAYKGAEDSDLKLLMSHDPSHWDLQIRPEYSDIDVTFSGHTHGMQFGIEAFGIKFSPVQWKYKQWAGLYKKGKQYLYVNRGLGFIGYPGRVGIHPEITVFEII